MDKYAPLCRGLMLSVDFANQSHASWIRCIIGNRATSPELLGKVSLFDNGHF